MNSTLENSRGKACYAGVVRYAGKRSVGCTKGVLPILSEAYTGRLLPKGGTFFMLQQYEMVEISLVEVFEREGKFVISVCKKAEIKKMHLKVK